MKPENLLRQCRKWNDFRSSLRPLSPKEKGDCFEALTRYFLRLDPAYSTKLNQVWPVSRVPARIAEFLNLPTTDEGIDLIAETKDGKYWAIQCKYREDEEASLSHPELSTFTSLAFNICRNVDLALVCTNADRLSRKLDLYGNRLSFCAGDVWRKLDQEFFQRLHRLLDGKAFAPEPRSPRPHQQRAISDALDYFVEQGNRRGKLIMPCGTGKTLVGFWCARELAQRRS